MCVSSFLAALRVSVRCRPAYPCSAVGEGDVSLHDHHACLSIPDAASVPGSRLATADREAIRRVETVVESQSTLVGLGVAVRQRRCWDGQQLSHFLMESSL